MKAFSVSLFFGVALSVACGEIVKVTEMTDKGLHFMWYPKLPEVKGWHSDQEATNHYKVNAMAPNGETFKHSPAVIYAKACYKPKVDEKTLAAFITADKKAFRSQEPGIQISELPSIETRSRLSMRCVEFVPKKNGNWERVAYFEEGDFYVVFTLSSRSKSSFDRSLPTYLQLLKGYRK